MLETGADILKTYANGSDFSKADTADCYASAPNMAWTDAAQNTANLIAGSDTTIRFLQPRKSVYPESSLSFDEIADRYRKMTELIKPSVTADGQYHYQDFIGDLVLQQDHANRVLRPIKDHLSAAADAMETVLADLE